MTDCTYPVIISMLIGAIGGGSVVYLLRPFCCRMTPQTETEE